MPSLVKYKGKYSHNILTQRRGGHSVLNWLGLSSHHSVSTPHGACSKTRLPFLSLSNNISSVKWQECSNLIWHKGRIVSFQSLFLALSFCQTDRQPACRRRQAVKMASQLLFCFFHPLVLRVVWRVIADTGLRIFKQIITVCLRGVSQTKCAKFVTWDRYSITPLY